MTIILIIMFSSSWKLGTCRTLVSPNRYTNRNCNCSVVYCVDYSQHALAMELQLCRSLLATSDVFCVAWGTESLRLICTMLFHFLGKRHVAWCHDKCRTESCDIADTWADMQEVALWWCSDSVSSASNGLSGGSNGKGLVGRLWCRSLLCLTALSTNPLIYLSIHQKLCVLTLSYLWFFFAEQGFRVTG